MNTHVSFILVSVSVCERAMLHDTFVWPLIYTEFTQGMILPTANGVTKQQTSQTKVMQDKTLVGVDSCWWHTLIL